MSRREAGRKRDELVMGLQLERIDLSHQLCLLKEQQQRQQHQQQSASPGTRKDCSVQCDLRQDDIEEHILRELRPYIELKDQLDCLKQLHERQLSKSQCQDLIIIDLNKQLDLAKHGLGWPDAEAAMRISLYDELRNVEVVDSHEIEEQVPVQDIQVVETMVPRTAETVVPPMRQTQAAQEEVQEVMRPVVQDVAKPVVETQTVIDMRPEYEYRERQVLDKGRIT